MPNDDPETLARAYYWAIDDGEYGRLADLLAPGFVQVRGDRTIEGREAFVRFMRDERPDPDTTHEVDAVYRRGPDPGGGVDAADGTDGSDGTERSEGMAGTDGADGTAVAVRGRLRRADGSTWFGFVDAFDVASGRLARLTTYTNRRVG